MLGPLEKSGTDAGPFTRPSNRISLDSPAPTAKPKNSHKKKSGRNERNNNNNGSAGMSISRACAEDLVEPGTCAACSNLIKDRYFLSAEERQWHMDCLRCCSCSRVLGIHQKCYVRNGQVYCKEDFYRNFTTKKCSRCLLTITNDELVMRARDLVYHVHCFACASCNHVLTTGENFGMRDNLIYCQAHFDPLMSDSLVPGSDFFDRSPSFSAGEFPADDGSVMEPDVNALFSGLNTSPQTKPKKKKKKVPVKPESSELKPDGSPKPKRTRTSFKNHQIRALKTYFAANSSPDTKDFKELAEQIGLSKRVLQVWFQNARAKMKRGYFKDDLNPQAATSGSQSPAPGSHSSAPGSHSPTTSQPHNNNSIENRSDAISQKSFGDDFPEDVSHSSSSQGNDVNSTSGSNLDVPELPTPQTTDAPGPGSAGTDLTVLTPSTGNFEATEADISALYPVTMTSSLDS